MSFRAFKCCAECGDTVAESLQVDLVARISQAYSRRSGAVSGLGVSNCQHGVGAQCPSLSP